MKKTQIMLLAGAVAASLAVLPAAAELPTYRVEVLGPNLQGFGMNEHGDVVGRKLVANVGHAFLVPMGAAEGTSIDLPVPAEWVSSDAYAVSDNGVIVGAVSTTTIATVGSHAAAWYPTPRGYQFMLLGQLPGHQYSTALGVNNLGDIVGGSGGIGLGLYTNAVRFTNPGVVELPGLSLPADVNDDRLVVAGNTILDLDTMTTSTIPLPPGNWQGMVAADINNVGGICGYISGFSGCSTFPVLYMPPGPMEIVGGCATTTAAVSVNDLGDTLTFVTNGGVGVVFAGENYMGIGPLIDPAEGNWLITGVSTINNARQMLVGGKDLSNPIAQLLRLTPIVLGDLDGNGTVNGADLGVLLGAWGSVGGPADLDGSGLVDGGDLGVLLGAWTN
ncbi:MAG: hypothetical protein JNM94_08230 [Phycisphaerae bacterium]|nr:hypothetical protein [Phycisphaerae bacterium]